ncbi:MAG: DUF397 domain-containing protein [Pseudonocardiaceae bacterium]
MPAPDMNTTHWRKSSRSTDQPNCVEVALTSSAVAVRDSKHLTGGTLVVPRSAWTAFTSALRDDELG